VPLPLSSLISLLLIDFFQVQRARTAAITSNSTGAFLGKAVTPIADLACRPSSPKISNMSSLAASITLGCW
jgi:hypothetical protein